MNEQPPRPRWLLAFITVTRAGVGIGDLSWEFVVDRLHHWPPTFVLAAWLLGAPIEELVRFFTQGRLQINVKRGEEPDEDPEKKES